MASELSCVTGGASPCKHQIKGAAHLDDLKKDAAGAVISGLSIYAPMPGMDLAWGQVQNDARIWFGLFIRFTQDSTAAYVIHR